MQTRLFTFSDEDLRLAASLLGEGEVIAFPTETVYGLGADARNGQAVQKIYEAKGRPQNNPLIIHVDSLEAATQLARFDEVSLALARAFWPGPLTLVLPQREGAGLAHNATAGLQTVGVRVPAHAIAQKFLKCAGCPVAAPSANRSGYISPTEADHVLDDLEGRIGGVIEGGVSEVGLESTILDCRDEKTGSVRILRPGGLSASRIAVTLQQVGSGAVELVGKKPEADDHKPLSPGQLSSHYAPRARLHLKSQSCPEGALLLGFGKDCPKAPGLNLSPTGNLVEAGANLFAYLRILDETGAGDIYVMPIPKVDSFGNELGEAINDRLQRAAVAS